MKINKVLDLKEKLIFYFLIFLFCASFLSWGIVFYYSKTRAIPKSGGEYIEGIVGQPQHINPVISASNSVDEDLVQLLYNGLLKYDSLGNLKNDLIESYEISEDKTLYTFHLKPDVTWHDGVPLTTDDIIFTINLISDPAYKSPLRYDWQGIETNQIDNQTITFQIKNPYVGFLNNLTFGILPKHIWEPIGAEKFTLTDLNLQPIGSGPYKYTSDSLQKDSTGNILSYKLVANPNYFEKKPYLSKITFNFYPEEDSALEAYKQKEVMGLNSISSQKLDQVESFKSAYVYKLRIPRYFAVFINQTKSFPLSHQEVREALSYATNREEIIEQVLDGNGLPVFSPILPDMIGFDENLEKRDFDPEKAEKILQEGKWEKNEDGIRAKDGKLLEINLYTTDWEELMQTGEILKAQWEKIGAKVNLNILSISDIQQNYIRPREYEALLFGQVLKGGDPDLFSFWHSSQKKDPGRNLSLFGDEDTDTLIDDGRSEFEQEKRSELYLKFQKKLNQEIPAFFLYSPEYLYPVNKKIKGLELKNLISPARRFTDIDNWYLKTQRIWK